MATWTARDMPDQSGRTAVVTGANSGIGAVAARELARAGARVILAVRDTDKGRVAAAGMPGSTEVRPLDLADLESVSAFAAGVDEPVDVLVNNAGVMALPARRTKDGFEMQLGTNHLGHFALTGLLLDRVRDRVVTLSSLMHRFGRIDFDDLQSERRYHRWKAYSQSKLANLLFAFELDRRLRAQGSPVRSIAAHPGYAATNLQIAGPRMSGSKASELVQRAANVIIAQDSEHGALPTLYAATMDVPSGAYVGPDGPFESRGHPRLVSGNGRSRDPETARRLWAVSEQLTGITLDFAPRSVAGS